MASDIARSDVKGVLNAFAAKKSVAFKVFLEIWKDLNCQKLIHSYTEQKGDIKSDEFTYWSNSEILNCLFSAILEFLSDKHSVYHRRGAVYFLYALYTNQLASADPVRISLTIELYGVILRLLQEVKNEKNKEVEFALNQLFSMGAFVIATDIQRKCLRISNVYMHYRALFEFINDDHTFFPLAMKQMKTKELQNVAASYFHAKEALALPECVRHPSRLHSQLSTLLPDYQKWIEDTSKSPRSSSASMTTPSTSSLASSEQPLAEASSESANLSQRRRSLIYQAYKSDASQQDSKGKKRKSAVSVTEQSSTTASDSPHKRRYGTRRRTPKT